MRKSKLTEYERRERQRERKARECSRRMALEKLLEAAAAYEEFFAAEYGSREERSAAISCGVSVEWAIRHLADAGVPGGRQVEAGEMPALPDLTDDEAGEEAVRLVKESRERRLSEQRERSWVMLRR